MRRLRLYRSDFQHPRSNFCPGPSLLVVMPGFEPGVRRFDSYPRNLILRGRLTAGWDALNVSMLVRFQPPQLEERLETVGRRLEVRGLEKLFLPTASSLQPTAFSARCDVGLAAGLSSLPTRVRFPSASLEKTGGWRLETGGAVVSRLA